MNAVCSVHPQASVSGVVRSGRVRTSSSQKIMPAILPKPSKDDHTNVPSKQLTHIGPSAVIITSYELGARVQRFVRNPRKEAPSCMRL